MHEWLTDARLVSWWLKWDDLSWPDAELEREWADRARAFAQAGANGVVFFGFHFRWDYLSVLERVLHILRRITEICHDQGLKVVDHHSASLIHRPRTVEDRWQIRTYQNHHVPFFPDTHIGGVGIGGPVNPWRQIDMLTGQPSYHPFYVAESLCPNNPDYQREYLNLVERHLEMVPLDAVMSDDLHYMPGLSSCGCEHCRRRFHEESGMSLPDLTENAFWEDRASDVTRAWMTLRYTWNADHYKRLRDFLPERVALWGCASTSLNDKTGEMGFTVQQFCRYWDAVFHEVYYKLDPIENRSTVIAELSAFRSLSVLQDIPTIAIFYARTSEDVVTWMEQLARFDVRPWVSKMVRQENVTPEQQLLQQGWPEIQMPPGASVSQRPVASIRYSQADRDCLQEELAGQYYAEACALAERLYDQGFAPFFVFDEYADAPRLPACTQQWQLRVNEGRVESIHVQ